jgi:hypothetical protein
VALIAKYIFEIQVVEMRMGEAFAGSEAQSRTNANASPIHTIHVAVLRLKVVSSIKKKQKW